MDITTYYLAENECFIEAKSMTPVGIVVHSTGANNPNLKRYVQPDDGRLGKGGSNHWNKKGVYKCAHAMIGKDKDGKVCTYLTLPTNVCAWGVGNGSKGSYNYPPTACLQFEICEDALTDKTYFEAVMKEAQELCAMWCKEFSLPVSSIRSHKEAHAEGYASNHADINHWLKKHGQTMDDFRVEVQKLLDSETAPSQPVGDWRQTDVPSAPSCDVPNDESPDNIVGDDVLGVPTPDGAANTPHPSAPLTPSPQGEGNTATIKDALLGLSEAIVRLANTL